MKIGYSSMNTHTQIQPAELAVAVEERGFESLWYGEHSQIPIQRDSPHPRDAELLLPRRSVPPRRRRRAGVHHPSRGAHDGRARPHELLPRGHRRDARQAGGRLRGAFRGGGAFIRERASVRVDVAAKERREGIKVSR